MAAFGNVASMLSDLAPAQSANSNAAPDDLSGATVTYDLGDGKGVQTAKIARPRVINLSVNGQPDPNPQVSGYILDNGASIGSNAVKSIDRPQTKSTGDQILADLDAVKNAPKEASKAEAEKPSGGLRNVAAGANEAIAGTLGAPVDLASAGLRALGLPIGQTPFLGSESIKKAIGTFATNPNDVEAKDDIDRLLRLAGAGAAAVPGGMMGFRAAAPTIGRLAGPLAGSVTGALGEGSLAEGAVAGAAGAPTGYVAAKNAPDALKPVANLAGNLVGGGAAVLPMAAARAGIDTAISEAGKFGIGKPEEIAQTPAGPVTATAEQARQAAERIASSAQDLDQVRMQLEESRNAPPGVSPTTPELTTDIGIGALGRAAATRDTAQFAERRAANNAARVQAIEGMANPEAKAASVGEYVRDRLSQIQGDHDARIGVARQAADKAMETIGGTMTPEQIGAAMRGAIAEHYGPQIAKAGETVEQARGRAAEMLGKLGGEPPATEQENVSALQRLGRSLRGALKEADDKKATEESRLWQSLDPDRTLRFDGSRIARAAKEIEGSISKGATPISGAERDILDRAKKFAANENLDPIKDLWSSIGEAMRDERYNHGSTQTLRRLAQLQNAASDVIENAVSRESQAHPEAPELFQRLKAETEAWKADNARREVGGGSVEGPGGSSDDGLEAVSSSAGAKSPPPGGSGNAPGDQSVQPSASDQLAQYRAARQSTRERKETFKEGPVGEILAQGARRGEYSLPESDVAGTAFKGGPGGAEAAQSLIKALGRENALGLVKDYAAFDLHRSAIKDGELDLTRYGKWMKDHDEALTAFPELKQAFGTAAEAQRAVREALGTQKTIEASNPIRPGAMNADVAAQYWAKGPKGAETVQKYLADAGGNKQALDDLSEYAAFDMRRNASRNGEINQAALDKWTRDHQGALSQLPELRSKLITASGAQRELDRLVAAKADQVDSFERGAAGRFLTDDPLKAVGKVFASSNPPEAMSDLVDAVKDSPAAREGLKRSVVDYIKQNFIGNAEAGGTGTQFIKSDAFNTFLKRNRAALAKILDISTLDMVGEDMRNAERAFNSSKIPLGSNTEQDRAAAMNFTNRLSLMSRILPVAGAVAGETIAHHFGQNGLMGGGAGLVLGQVLGGLRKEGGSAVDRLVDLAMLHPEVARALLQKIPIAETEKRLPVITRLVRNALYSDASSYAAKGAR